MGDRPGIAMTALDVFAFYQICNMLTCMCLLKTLHSTNASYQAINRLGCVVIMVTAGIGA